MAPPREENIEGEEEDEEGVGLGYDPEEASDFSEVGNPDLREKKELLRWRFREGGHRIPLFFPKIPHVDETTIPLHVLRDEAEMLALCEKIASEARQAQGEFIYSKQQADVLQQEKDLLKWHVANNTKALSMKRSELRTDEQRNMTLRRHLQELSDENDTFERAQETLTKETEKLDLKLEEARTDLEEKQGEMQEWLSRRGDFISDTALERRRAAHERSLRLRQWKKLDRACNADKRLHVKLDVLKRWDGIVFDMQKRASAFLAERYEGAGNVIGKAREKLTDPDIQPQAEALLEDFVSSAMAKAAAAEEEEE